MNVHHEEIEGLKKEEYAFVVDDLDYCLTWLLVKLVACWLNVIRE